MAKRAPTWQFDRADKVRNNIRLLPGQPYMGCYVYLMYESMKNRILLRGKLSRLSIEPCSLTTQAFSSFSSNPYWGMIFFLNRFIHGEYTYEIKKPRMGSTLYEKEARIWPIHFNEILDVCDSRRLDDYRRRGVVSKVSPTFQRCTKFRRITPSEEQSIQLEQEGYFNIDHRCPVIRSEPAKALNRQQKLKRDQSCHRHAD